ncbi:carbon starvation CstA family protein [Hippea jasoniae]|uniref:carbon starvation CstA family protein n=1 Tax=Hippea jasoniae TaxID=944479 RepID=UPI0005566CBA|nr:carbon starvation protein A [Hippea jasoniae]
MSSTALILIGLAVYIIAYFGYGKYLQKSVVGKSERDVPAKRLYDGTDFVPANKYVLFGHHFASIAGAAPIVGPVIALAWGWLPAILWIWFGNVLIGAVHDYLSLMSSVRYDGHSVQWVAGKVIKKRTSYIFAWFIFFVLILVVAAFGAVLGMIFVKQPAVPTAYILQVIFAIILGYVMYKLKAPFSISTLLAIALLAVSIYLAVKFPTHAAYKIWMVVFFFYIIIAAALPVNILLQPRDYMNAWLLVAGLLIGGIAVVFAFKPMAIPATTMFSPPIIGGKASPFWPTIPLIIACGSLSGFHALVASGTSSKQLSEEVEGLFIGYGGMLTEGFLSTLVVLSIGIAGAGILHSGQANFLTDPQAFGNNYLHIMKSSGGPVGVFAKSYATVVYGVLGIPKVFMIILAAMWVASFAMTTLDTTNRLARYTFTEILEPIKDSARGVYDFFTNKWVASIIPAAIGIALAWSGEWKIIWPAFGAANQMLASIALFTVSAWVMRVQKKPSWSILSVAIFLWITVTSAMIWYLITIVPSSIAKNPIQGYILAAIMVIMLILNFILMFDFLKPDKNIGAEAKENA